MGMPSASVPKNKRAKVFGPSPTPPAEDEQQLRRAAVRQISADLGGDTAGTGRGVGDVKVHSLPDEIAGLTLERQVRDIRARRCGLAQAQGREDQNGEATRAVEHAEFSFFAVA